jgi:excisionase family DNA binding protein
MQMIEISRDSFFTVAEIMEGLDWKQSTTYERMQNGLPYHKIGHDRLIRGQDLLEYLEQHRFVEDQGAGL